MRNTILFNDQWIFIKEGCAESVNLPHTWNAKDGQDGGNDYYRGTCTYQKRFVRPETDGEVWLQFNGAAMTTEVFLNGQRLARHEGGYSTFRVNLTDDLLAENELTVTVDNGRNRSVYPQKADFTFYGGLYRDVMLIEVPKEHFALDYIWAMHCWNGFDFGADGRDEGGKPGQNQKGLITFDRKIKKDAFYVYKAYLSDEPFVHLCGRRYAERAEEMTEIKVYSNQKYVSLFVDGKEFESKAGNRIFRFEVPISSEHEIKAVSGKLSDAMIICKVDSPNRDYIKDGADIVNWFDRDDEIEKPGYFSIKDSMGLVKANKAAQAVMDELVAPIQAKLVEAYGDVAKNFQMPPEMMAMMERMSVEAALKQMGKLITPEFVHKLNHALNQIKK